METFGKEKNFAEKKMRIKKNRELQKSREWKNTLKESGSECGEEKKRKKNWPTLHSNVVISNSV